MKASYSLSLLALVAKCSAWGAVGHEMVATIAQIHLHEDTKAAIRELLPNDPSGHLAPIASWADRVRMIPDFRFSGELHYTSPLGDYPPEACFFGEKGWKTNHDILHAITNYTTRLSDDPYDGVALRFLVHFIGDVHQPLHLTNRERGGNGDPVIFEGRRMNLHSLWDTALITKAVREQTNYTEPLPAAQIESALRGTIYDPYIRLILWEGVRLWWRSSLPAWLLCALPLTDFTSPLQQQLRFSPQISVVCPEEWARQTHKITCENVFPKEYNFTAPPVELNTKEYYGPIREHNTIERLLAQGGLRLAATLNSIFGPSSMQAEGENLGLLDFSWLEDAPMV